MTIRITSSYFVAGVVPGERAAPIIKYMQEWTPVRIREYCKKKGWVYEEVQDTSEV